jgi:CheY-like chemotaxis protein
MYTANLCWKIRIDYNLTEMVTILIIEDEPELVRVLRTYLEQAGFSVLSSGRGDTGLSIWEHNDPTWYCWT